VRSRTNAQGLGRVATGHQRDADVVCLAQDAFIPENGEFGHAARPERQEMRSHLPTWILEIAKMPGNDIHSSEFDRRVNSYAESDVCTQCKIDAAFEIQERLKDYNKRFVSRDTSPYLSRLAERGACTCKHTAT